MFQKIRDGLARMTSATDELSVSEAGCSSDIYRLLNVWNSIFVERGIL
jgi:hypothetical protein